MFTELLTLEYSANKFLAGACCWFDVPAMTNYIQQLAQFIVLIARHIQVPITSEVVYTEDGHTVCAYRLRMYLTSNQYMAYCRAGNLTLDTPTYVHKRRKRFSFTPIETHSDLENVLRADGMLYNDKERPMANLMNRMKQPAASRHDGANVQVSQRHNTSYVKFTSCDVFEVVANPHPIPVTDDMLLYTDAQLTDTRRVHRLRQQLSKLPWRTMDVKQLKLAVSVVQHYMLHSGPGAPDLACRLSPTTECAPEHVVPIKITECWGMLVKMMTKIHTLSRREADVALLVYMYHFGLTYTNEPITITLVDAPKSVDRISSVLQQCIADPVWTSCTSGKVVLGKSKGELIIESMASANSVLVRGCDQTSACALLLGLGTAGIQAPLLLGYLSARQRNRVAHHDVGTIPERYNNELLLLFHIIREHRYPDDLLFDSSFVSRLSSLAVSIAIFDAVAAWYVRGLGAAFNFSDTVEMMFYRYSTYIKADHIVLADTLLTRVMGNSAETTRKIKLLLTDQFLFDDECNVMHDDIWIYTAHRTYAHLTKAIQSADPTVTLNDVVTVVDKLVADKKISIGIYQCKQHVRVRCGWAANIASPVYDAIFGHFKSGDWPVEFEDETKVVIDMDYVDDMKRGLENYDSVIVTRAFNILVAGNRIVAKIVNECAKYSKTPSDESVQSTKHPNLFKKIDLTGSGVCVFQSDIPTTSLPDMHTHYLAVCYGECVVADVELDNPVAGCDQMSPLLGDSKLRLGSTTRAGKVVQCYMLDNINQHAQRKFTEYY